MSGIHPWTSRWGLITGTLINRTPRALDFLELLGTEADKQKAIWWSIRHLSSYWCMVQILRVVAGRVRNRWLVKVAVTVYLYNRIWPHIPA